MTGGWRWVAAIAVTWLGACATGSTGVPPGLRGFEVVAPARDTLSRAVAEALERAGMRVRTAPQGGAKAPAVLVCYEFQEPGPAGRRWLYARLFHARTTAVLSAARLSVDSLPGDGPARARLLAAALLAPPDTALTIDEPSR